MQLSQCYLECAKIKSNFTDENGTFKLLMNKKAKFKIQILDILPTANPKNENDYFIGFSTRQIVTLQEVILTEKEINEFYI